MKFKFKMAAVLTVLAGLAACGGGSANDEDGDGKLYVSLGWPDNWAYLLQDASLAPKISGLEGNTPHCTLKSGSLPPGMSVTDSCYIVGKPRSTGSYDFVVDFSVRGVENHLDFRNVVTVFGPRIYYVAPTLSYGKAVDIAPAIEGNWKPQPGTPLSYSLVSGALPAGLTLDTNTGHISGTPNALGTTEVHIRPKITADVGSVDLADATASFTVSASDIQYPSLSALVGVPLTPVLPTGKMDGVGYSFAWASGFTPPAGLSLDPSSGALSGTPAAMQANPMYLKINFTMGSLAPKLLGTYYTAMLPYSISYSCASGMVNTPYSCAPNVYLQTDAGLAGIKASSANFNYALATGSSLPPGLSLDPVTGAISGTPTARAWTDVRFKVVVTLNGVTFNMSPAAYVNIN